jgi:hypothetical protein
VAANPILASGLTLPCIPTLAGCTNGSLTASLPALSYSGDSRDLKWNTLSPRIGATYSLGADKRTLLRASYNRYASQLGSAVSGANPLAYSAFYFYGVDANGDHTIQRNELAQIKSFVGVDAANPASVALTRRIDYGMKVPTTDEIIVGVERELMSDFSVGANYTYRKYNDLFTTRYEKTPGSGNYYTSADYVQVFNTDGSPKTAGGNTFYLCNGAINSTTGLCTGTVVTQFTTNKVGAIYQLAPGIATPLYRVLTTRPNYSQKYSGVELTATKRLSHKWMFRGNFSYNDYTESCGKDSFANPTPTVAGTSAAFGGPNACPGGQLAPASAGSGAFGNDFIGSKWNFNTMSTSVAASAGARATRRRCVTTSPACAAARSTSCSTRSGACGSTTSTSSTSA